MSTVGLVPAPTAPDVGHGDVGPDERWLRRRLTAHVDQALERCDALLLPTLPTGAPALGAATVEAAGRREPVRAAMLRLTQLFNVTGHPALALPAAVGRDGLPRSLQVVCRETSRVLEAALALERCLSH